MSDAAAFSRAYSAADRTIHKIATGRPDLQLSLARLEERLWGRELAGIEPGPPIFITSLPRAGTTLLLEVLAAHPDLTSHTYRHMPFLMCPLLWDRLSRGFRQREAKRERAHGDGMAVGYDSVEAFEEILWMAFFPDRFQKDRIRPWTERTKSLGLPEFLTRHMAKMVLLSGGASRYVSKNNANIARIGWLSRALPEAAIVVPFREPSGHIRSMLRQHRGFAEAQKDAPFVREYMESIGHFEFGEAHRPIDFGGWLERAAGLSPETETYWARYWVAAMETVLAEAEGRTAVHLLSYDGLCADPEAGLATLGDRLGLGDDLVRHADRFRAPTGHGAEPLDVPPDLAEEVSEIQAKLTARAI